MKTSLNHIALQYDNKKDAEIFFSDILGIKKIRSFSLTEEFSNEIFGIDQPVDIDVFDNGDIRFEIFYTDIKNNLSFTHVCIEIDDKELFIDKCKKNGLKPYFVKKGEKNLLFVRDFSDNLYEIKEK